MGTREMVWPVRACGDLYGVGLYSTEYGVVLKSVTRADELNIVNLSVTLLANLLSHPHNRPRPGPASEGGTPNPAQNAL